MKYAHRLAKGYDIKHKIIIYSGHFDGINISHNDVKYIDIC